MRPGQTDGNELKLQTFVARQPILDSRQKLEAYELLFRSGLENQFNACDGDQATCRVIAGSFLLFGIEDMTGKARAFINFTRRLLVEDYALVLPHERAVVELLETVEPDPEVVDACWRLKKKGFTLALDDFVFSPEYQPLLDLADIVKVDYLATPPETRAAMAREFSHTGIIMLAEKVESHEHFREGLDLGYRLFQGYFFSKPEIVSRRDIPASKINYLNMLAELNRPGAEVGRVAKLIRRDVAISYKILRYLNSAAFMLRNKISSIQQAVALLGLDEVRKWASLLALSGMSGDRPQELLAASAVRAKTAELLAPLSGLGGQKEDAFLMGLFSMLDAIFGRPMEEVLTEITLEPQVAEALLGKQNRFRQLLRLVIALDQGRWRMVSRLASGLGVDETALPELYQKAVIWQLELWSML